MDPVARNAAAVGSMAVDQSSSAEVGSSSVGQSSSAVADSSSVVRERCPYSLGAVAAAVVAIVLGSGSEGIGC